MPVEEDLFIGRQDGHAQYRNEDYIDMLRLVFKSRNSDKKRTSDPYVSLY